LRTGSPRTSSSHCPGNPSLFVIGRDSCFAYKGRTVDAKQIGGDLGVRYVLQGSVRKSGSRMRVTGQLVEAETDNHCWAERYDRDLADIFAVQDEIADAVTKEITQTIADAERRRALRKPPEDLDTWAAYQRGLWHLERSTAEDNAIAKKFFREAINRDGSIAGGYTGLAWTQVSAGGAFRTQELAQAQHDAQASARRAVALDPADAEARACLASVLVLLGDLPGALKEADRARAISPNLASAHGEFGAASMLSGRCDEGIASLQMSIHLDPRSPRLAHRLTWIITGHYFKCEYETAVEKAERAIRSYPEYPSLHRWLAASLGQLGRVRTAKQALDRATSVNPALFDLYVTERPPWFRPEDHAHMIDGLRRAGWEREGPNA